MKIFFYIISSLFVLFISKSLGSFSPNDISFLQIKFNDSGKIIRQVKRDPFVLLKQDNSCNDGSQFIMESRDDAELFLAYFILRHLKLNDSKQFAKELKVMGASYMHIKQLDELLKNKIKQDGKSISFKEFLLSNGPFFFMNDSSQESKWLFEKVKQNTILFYPNRHSKLVRFLVPVPKFDYMHLYKKELKGFYSYLLELIFQRNVSWSDFKKTFDKFQEDGRQVLMKTMDHIWGGPLINNELSIEKVNKFMSSLEELKFVDALVEADCEIRTIRIDPDIRISFANKEFLEGIPFFDYLSEHGVFFTLANYHGCKASQKFIKILSKNAKIVNFFDRLPLLRSISRINSLGKILFRYSVNSVPQLKEDIFLIRELSDEELNVLRKWEAKEQVCVARSPTITASITMDGGREEILSSIHDALLELSMDPNSRALKLMSRLIFDDIFFWQRHCSNVPEL